MLQQIALRNGFIHVPAISALETVSFGHGGAFSTMNAQLVMSVQAELMKLGYMLDSQAFNSLLEADSSFVIKYHDEIIAYLKKALGADKAYRPFYVNFPQEVMELSNLELFLNAIIHYWSNGQWEPAQELKSRGVKFEHTKFKLLKPVSGDEWLRKIANDLASFTKPLDEQKLNDLVWIAKNVKNVEVPPITVKETLCALIANGINVKATSVVDVLRVATYLSGGDISLPSIPKPKKLEGARGYRLTQRRDELRAEREKFKFKKFSRPQRKAILGLLESLPKIDVSEMQRHLGRWQRLGEILHPGELKAKYPKAAAAFDRIRNQQDSKVRTFAGQVDVAMKKSLDDGLSVLKTRPGEFARRLDSLLRAGGSSGLTNYKHEHSVLTHFGEVIDRVSTKVVFEMFDHFEGRRKASPRMVMLKGSGAKSKVLSELPPLDKSTVDALQAQIVASLSRRMAKLGPMGKVYVDPELKNVPIPFSMQSSSEGITTLPRGTRTPFDENANTLRAFVHWYDNDGSVDIDLAAGLYDASFKDIDQITFYNLRNQAVGAVHSGDVRHRRGSCAEYIDIPVEKALALGVRYVIFYAYNYNGGSMASIKETTFGVMERKHPGSNEIFEPRTISSAIKLQGKTRCTSPVAFDLESKQWIWMDLEHDQRGIPMLAHDATTRQKLEAILKASKLSIYDLLMMHVDARNGRLVDSAEDADQVYLEPEFRGSYTKAAELLAV